MKNESPKYRFDKFDENWFLVRISNIASQFKTGGTPSTKEPNFWGGTIPWIQSSDIQKDTLFGVIPQKFISEEGLQNSSAKLIPKSSIAIVTRVGVGKLAIIEQDYTTSQDFLSLSDLNGDIQFLVYSIYRMLQKESTQLQGTSIKGITKEELLSKKISLPDIKEQSAIGSLFRTLDDLLASYKDNLANYQSLKTTMLSKMFPKVGQTVPEIRLDGFKGEWEINKLNKYLTVSKQKNTQLKFDKEDVLSVSGEFGIINQIQFQGRSFAGASVEMYSIVDTGNIVYTKSPLKANPYGIIKTNYGIPGIVSTLYAVYLPNENVFPGFVERYFENDLRLNSYLKPLVNKGAKNDMKVSDENTLLGAVIFPQLEEQVAISDYFTNLDKFIQSHKDKISQLETLKKKLLQDMFI
ncbi:restriction endonuclease subunit S [Streptococcus salivarius]|uniref:restriction endonuclease subunit S n=1 Tax=Streptococcus salivarius TaxID=1304 RepID=UPI0009C203A7|nr:restriction endonuclease subunit S [Streptococcus salivarius]ARC34095.1 restriction endonuclease subunit S [Streptococcus equinus]MBS5180482.1 restriction endonuclease subunit S [Streptococcus salivarius]MBS6531137.1 restriction endonuclease subunit S [Streptococcus salivarius]MDU2932858.1 restriction endonuclease subunit S [Streptococcus salivarius]MTR23262.1 restriction endonuclease subunit S [Streptococcus salivarius]